MHTVEQSVDVNVDVSTAYDQWTRFDSFPQWMEGVASVEQTGGGRTVGRDIAELHTGAPCPRLGGVRPAGGPGHHDGLTLGAAGRRLPHGPGQPERDENGRRKR